MIMYSQDLFNILTQEVLSTAQRQVYIGRARTLAKFVDLHRRGFIGV